MKLRYLFLLPLFFITSMLAATPVARCQSPVTVALPTDACVVSLSTPMINAGSYETSGISFSLSLSGHQNLAPGSHWVLLTISTNFASRSCWSRVLVEDKTAPTITCHDKTRYHMVPFDTYAYSYQALTTISDNCASTLTIDSDIPYDLRVGIYPFTVSVTDAGGNTAGCSGTITVHDLEPQNYCTSSRNDYFEHIINVQLNSSSDALNRTSGADGGYRWHQPLELPILFHGTSYILAFTPGYRFNTPFHEYWSIYLDKNRDGDFTDAGELLSQWDGIGGQAIGFTSPGTHTGWSRIRVVMRYDGYAASPCGVDGDGETEDLSVYLRPYFWFPPGWKQQDQATTPNMVTSQELVFGSERLTEQALPGTAEQRTPITTPGQTSSFHTISQTDIRVFPNPVRGGQPLTISGVGEASELMLRNIAGRIVKKYPPGVTRVEVPANLPAGIYLLSGITMNSGTIWTRRVVVK